MDISTRALELNFNIVALNSQKVRHLGAQTITPLDPHRIEATKVNRQTYISKWTDKIPQIMESLYGSREDTK